MSKQEIRTKGKEIRAGISKEDRMVYSSMVRQHLYMLPQLKEAKIILMYASTGDEVDTWALIDWMLKNNKTVLLPIVQGDNMIVAEYCPDDILVSNRFGVMEPDPAYEVDPMTIQIALVPGLAFDEKGNRVGSGKGYYDRFLRNIPCVKVGLCYDDQMVDMIDPEENDIPMDAVATNKKLVLCYQ